MYGVRERARVRERERENSKTYLQGLKREKQTDKDREISDSKILFDNVWRERERERERERDCKNKEAARIADNSFSQWPLIHTRRVAR